MWRRQFCEAKVSSLIHPFLNFGKTLILRYSYLSCTSLFFETASYPSHYGLEFVCFKSMSTELWNKQFVIEAAFSLLNKGEMTPVEVIVQLMDRAQMRRNESRRYSRVRGWYVYFCVCVCLGRVLCLFNFCCVYFLANSSALMKLCNSNFVQHLPSIGQSSPKLYFLALAFTRKWKPIYFENKTNKGSEFWNYNVHNSKQVRWTQLFTCQLRWKPDSPLALSRSSKIDILLIMHSMNKSTKAWVSNQYSV